MADVEIQNNPCSQADKGVDPLNDKHYDKGHNCLLERHGLGLPQSLGGKTMPKPRFPCYREPHLVSLLKGGTAQAYSVTFSSTEVAPVSFPGSQRQSGSLPGLLQEKYPEAHQLRRRFGSSCTQTEAEVAFPWKMFGTARVSTQRKS